MHILKYIEEYFYDHMSDLMLNPEERYEILRFEVINYIHAYCAEHNCAASQQTYQMGCYDEDDHWCDYMALYINGERQGLVVVEKPRKPYIPYRSTPGASDRIPFYGNPMSPDYEEPSWEDAILEQQESWYDE